MIIIGTTVACSGRPQCRIFPPSFAHVNHWPRRLRQAHWAPKTKRDLPANPHLRPMGSLFSLTSPLPLCVSIDPECWSLLICWFIWVFTLRTSLWSSNTKGTFLFNYWSTIAQSRDSKTSNINYIISILIMKLFAHGSHEANFHTLVFLGIHLTTPYECVRSCRLMARRECPSACPIDNGRN